LATRRIEGQTASPGHASGPIFILARAGSDRIPGSDAGEEAGALEAAIQTALTELAEIGSVLDGEAAEMLAFQAAMLADPALAEDAFAAVRNGEEAGRAWTAALNAEIEGYRAGADEYFRARAADLEDMRDRVLAKLTGRKTERIPPGAIAIADDIAPSLFLTTDWSGGGIALRRGSATSHVAMLARSRGVPMVVGIGDGFEAPAGCPALLDGAAGCLIIAPGAEEVAAFEASRAAASREAAEGEFVLREPARTADGRTVAILLNIADPAELDGLDPAICDGIGLVRTELLFEGRALPDEEAQTAVYSRIARWAAGRPVTIRVLDAGGDKPNPGLTLDGESNPFLGIRGIRLLLRRPEVLRTQLRALARAASEGAIEVMLPMVSVPDEIAAARRMLDEACVELADEGRPHRRPLLGIMVEVPAVAVTPERFEADFYSIGSNDLVQYTLAASRDIAAFSERATVMDAAVLQLIANVADHGACMGRKVSICGDAAGDPVLIPHLLAAGLTQLSMAPSQVARAKLAIRGVSLAPGGGR
jgi:phosphoenolpyruvate-protein phosphotransferase (PTS system enzyme I)